MVGRRGGRSCSLVTVGWILLEFDKETSAKFEIRDMDGAQSETHTHTHTHTRHCPRLTCYC